MHLRTFCVNCSLIHRPNEEPYEFLVWSVNQMDTCSKFVPVCSTAIYSVPKVVTTTTINERTCHGRLKKCLLLLV